MLPTKHHWTCSLKTTWYIILTRSSDVTPSSQVDDIRVFFSFNGESENEELWGRGGVSSLEGVQKTLPNLGERQNKQQLQTEQEFQMYPQLRSVYIWISVRCFFYTISHCNEMFTFLREVSTSLMGVLYLLTETALCSSVNFRGPLGVPSLWTKLGIQGIGIYIHSAKGFSVIDAVYVAELLLSSLLKHL